MDSISSLSAPACWIDPDDFMLQVVEFDTPHALITKEGGIFRDMCLKSGSFDELLAVATSSGGDASPGTDVL